MLLSQPIENIDQEISQLYALIETKKAYQATLIELDAKADDLLEQLGELVAKVKYHAPDEIGSLRNAVLNLFDGDDNNNVTWRKNLFLYSTITKSLLSTPTPPAAPAPRSSPSSLNSPNSHHRYIREQLEL